MIRGDYLDLSKDALNTILKAIDDDSEPLQFYHKLISQDDYVSSEYDNTKYFREKCLKAGFVLKELYPIYYQNWEMDEWGAIGIKDGKIYRLETDHGSLKPVEIKHLPYFKSILTVIFDDDI